MGNDKFTLIQFTVKNILAKIEAGEFVIPEIQRPFVWRRNQVRDLIDSLYNGYPTGYIITWQNPDIRTKDGGISRGKHILIDGQQRITAIMAALVGQEVMNEDFNHERIKISFNPQATDATKRFAVLDASRVRDKKWIPDISVIFKPEFRQRSFENSYVAENPEVDVDELADTITSIKEIENRNIGVIELDQNLDIDEVTEIFIRINSKGTALSQSDFVMSKLAADTVHGGNLLRKIVDYFCHLSVKPDFYAQMMKDTEFIATPYAEKIKWLADDNEAIYDPDYSDVLHVAFMSQFNRGKLADLVSLLSGRNFETKEYSEDIIEESYKKLQVGLDDFINKYHFQNFVLAIKSAGFRSSKLINSHMTLDFAYMIYLRLTKDKNIPAAQVSHHVQKWFVLSTLTGRYVSSPESMMSHDIRLINEKGFLAFSAEIEASVLSDTFWQVTLPQNLTTNSVNSPAFHTFIAAQINRGSSSLFQRGTSIGDLVELTGDVHHIFPKAYLQKNGLNNRALYNQVANYTYLDTQVNKAISDNAPNIYFGKIREQQPDGKDNIGNITNIDDLQRNLAENAIPEDIVNMTYKDYETFLDKRRRLMAKFIEGYYKAL